ncbi:hypothetical protein JTE90_009364 [Oedothorax gibbosus]|uniref:F-box only protein 9 n=1 Tax=Oedothorax gibbosus TaxID=931172 RepID=A0AAV6VUL4_9ARAC|nr:hypothetical protein JTE90_009364 [Oedothorax gibbosus]
MENSNGNPSSSNSSGSLSGGEGTETTGETQDEEPSSSSHPVNLELDNFRLQWKREIEQSPSKRSSSKGRNTLSEDDIDEALSLEERSKWLFLRGVQAEKQKKLQEAIALYRRAIQLVPDIEFRIEENIIDTYGEYSPESSDDSLTPVNLSDSEDEIDNLVYKFQKISTKEGTSRICQPKHQQMASHISSLPPEIFIYILKWVISQDLDLVSLEQIAKVCRGFYLCSRDSEIWRLICLRTWDVNTDTPNRYGCWRNMFLQRPHLSFNGVYISKTTYVRYGESSFQDTNYRPCYIVEYYRYLRFFPDGTVLMFTTPDDPYQSIYKLRDKKCKQPNVMSGRYKLVGSTVMAIMKKPKSDLASSQSNYNRYRRQRQANVLENQDETFHLGLEVKNAKKRINCQLIWNHYSIHIAYRNGQEKISDFDIVPSKFPSFWFSRVKSYTAASESPLM